MSEMQRDLLKSRLPPKSAAGNVSRFGRRDYTPTEWSDYFGSREDVRLDDGSIFRVYRCQSSNYEATEPCIFLLHGAGYSGLTWSCFAKEIVALIQCSVVAIDIRGHGESRTGDEEDLSKARMTEDVEKIYERLFRDDNIKPPVILVGHSMGGALAVHVTVSDKIPSIIGLTVIDVVEGTALDALQGMQTLLRSRPKSFDTLEKAIEWSCRSGQTKNLESAKVSMPSMLKRICDDEPATKEMKPSSDAAPEPSGTGSGGIPEDSEMDFSATEEKTSGFTWRIDLSKSERHWRGWFENLSSSFLSCPCPKMLLLAGMDRLDRDLTIGQMQGKFQTHVLPKVGHAVHEDAPEKVAEAISAFLVRNKICRKIGDFEEPAVSC